MVGAETERPRAICRPWFAQCCGRARQMARTRAAAAWWSSWFRDPVMRTPPLMTPRCRKWFVRDTSSDW